MTPDNPLRGETAYVTTLSDTGERAGDDRSAPPPANAAAHEERARAIRESLRRLSKGAAKAATALTPLTRSGAFDDPKKLGKLLAKVEGKLPSDVPSEAGVAELLHAARRWEVEAPARLRRELSRELRGACEREGLSFRVVSREDPVEVRIAPFSVVLDFEKGKAELRFARVPIATARPEVRAILDAHARARKDLDTAFEPSEFFDRCARAWRAARAAAGDASERVEILDFLPYLAVEMQPPKFRVEPTANHFADYGRARFAWDVLRLRRARMLSHGGLRLNLGVATGTTASQKKRVLYFEDEEGNGEFKLTIFFTKSEEGRG